MRKLVNNELNDKIILNNLKHNTLSNYIILQGEYGTGKTEYAIEIARYITCTNKINDTYCGTCANCKRNENINDTGFDSPVVLHNMASVKQQDFIASIQDSHRLLQTSGKVIILDEAQAISKQEQEALLSEFRFFKDVYLIFTTTNIKSLDKGLISRAISLKMSKLPITKIDELLHRACINSLEPAVISEIYKYTNGVPRDVLKIGSLIHNGNLTFEEALDYLLDNKYKLDFVDLFNNVHDRIYVLNKCLEIKNNCTKREIDDKAIEFLSEIMEGKHKSITDTYNIQTLYKIFYTDGDRLAEFLKVMDILTIANADNKVKSLQSARKTEHFVKDKVQNKVEEW